MNFVRFKLIATNIAVLLFAARTMAMVSFYYFGDMQSFYILLAIMCCSAFAVFMTYVIGSLNLPRRMFLSIKNRIKSQRRHGKEPSRLLQFAYGFIAHYRLHDGGRLKNFLWYCFEIEVIATTVIFVYTRGWGYGFELFLVVIFVYFYMNFRFVNRQVYLVPCAIGLIYILLYLFSEHHDFYSAAQVAIYVINGTFALIMLFAVQIASEIGKVIKVINDRNRLEYIRSLSSLDALSGTLAKYSFLDVASARLEHSPEEDIISQASVILIEFSNLALINKHYTMQIGDVAIKEFAYMIQQNCQNYDCYITRWAGDQFLVFLINEDDNVANMLAEQISKEAAFNRFSIKGIRINSEYAIASNSNFNYELGDLIDEAILLLKQQKEQNNTKEIHEYAQ